MFDFQAVHDAAVEKVAAAARRCVAGDFLLERGARARRLLIVEAEETARRAIRDTFAFEPADFTSYCEALPDLLDAYVLTTGNFGDVIAETIRQRLHRDVMPDVLLVLHEVCRDENAYDMLDGLESVIKDDLDPIPQFLSHRLVRLMADCREAPGVESLEALSRYMDSEASWLRGLANSLDIADPPTAAYAVRGARRLQEAADLYELVRRLDLVDAFCQRRPEAAEARGRTAR